MVQKSIEAPVELEELKQHLHILTTDFDNSLELYIQGAVAKAEAYTGRYIWQVSDTVSVPFSKIYLNNSDLKVVKIKVDDVEVNFTVNNSIVFVDAEQGEQMEIFLQEGYVSETCPADIKMAVLLIASKFFNNPVDPVEQLPSASAMLLHPYKLYKL